MLYLKLTLRHFNLKLSFNVQSGQTTVLLGESGAGKSTVLPPNSAGLQRPNKGLIVLDGITYYNSIQHIFIPPQKRPFGYVFQDYVLFPHLTVFENVAFGLRAQHLSRQSIRQQVIEVFERVHLTDPNTGFQHRSPADNNNVSPSLRALALRPQLLLLDEPLAALDVHQTRNTPRITTYPA